MPYYEMMPAGLPAGLQTGMDAVLNKKMGTAGSYPPGTWPDTVNLLGLLDIKTALPVNDEITITDAAEDVPFKAINRRMMDTIAIQYFLYQQYRDGTSFDARSRSYEIDLGRPVYGAEFDVVSGTGTETHAGIKVSDLNWTYYTAGTNPIFYANNVPDMHIYSRGEMPSIKLNGFTTKNSQTRSYLSANLQDMEISATENVRTITFRYTAATSVADMLADLGNLTICYELEAAAQTPLIFQGQTLLSFGGTNIFTTNSNLYTSVEYRSNDTVAPSAVLTTKNITANGTYNASADSADGYSSVTVNVPETVPTVTPIMSANAFVTKSGVSGTNVSQVIRSITADAAGKLVFASGSYGVTNTGSNDGYFDIQLNGTSLVKQYCNTSTNTPITIPNTDVAQNDVLDIIVGFDNAHSNCNFQLYTAVVLVS